MNASTLLRAGSLLLLFAAGVLFLLQPRSSVRIAPGEPLGDVRSQLTNGRRFDLAEHRGQPVVLAFWATWCRPCLQEVPELNRLAASGVKVIGLSVDSLPLAEIGAKAERIGIRYPVGETAPGLAERLGITNIPTTCVVAKDGTLLRAHSGFTSFDELRSELGN
jgi:thiol-disulfide isomerase/thioredoxin